jgi:hypothetical protein
VERIIATKKPGIEASLVWPPFLFHSFALPVLRNAEVPQCAEMRNPLHTACGENYLNEESESEYILLCSNERNKERHMIRAK